MAGQMQGLIQHLQPTAVPTTTSAGGAAAPQMPQSITHRDVTSPNPEKFSGELVVPPAAAPVVHEEADPY
ncbi:hypothetical protein ILYODFUR_031609 [Ilyodon furcidens]|uniref:Uncharacterized protein n=1 Tax=Ilyodon furcidens TaxID=33524 RepID=A0ABV0UC00_9TELE